ncbi:preprotein translocase subunit Sec61beta [Candidatus Woesearchaeota archaeon]|nr:preprotein translocase subunit Sec61beta [Candidatus Woesearchaeota archaeon]
MAENRVSMPQSSGGLVRYFDEYDSKIMIKPHHIIILVVLVILLEIVLHVLGKQLLG